MTDVNVVGRGLCLASEEEQTAVTKTQGDFSEAPRELFSFTARSAKAPADRASRSIETSITLLTYVVATKKQICWKGEATALPRLSVRYKVKQNVIV